MNENNLKTLSESEFREALKKGIVKHPRAVPQDDGYYRFEFNVRSQPAAILSFRKDRFRKWKDLTRMATQLKEMGVDKLEVRLN
jgi:hypothetical protein